MVKPKLSAVFARFFPHFSVSSSGLLNNLASVIPSSGISG
jgi:hypothetical protein